VHRASGTSCVVKSVKKDAAGERYRQSVEQEGGIFEMLLRMSHKELRHPNLVRYFDMLEGPKHYFVIMEELSGAELMQQVEDLFPVTEAYLQRVLRQVLAGLAHIHGPVGTVHRDVKLSNFRYRSPGSESELVLLDFGFASSLSRPWDGAVCGTMMFMAPEVVGHTVQTATLAAIDLWAAGVMLYVLLTGDAPAQEDEVRILGKKDALEEAQEVLDKAFAAQELALASPEALSLLRALLTLDPGTRATASQALDHAWFSSEGDTRQVSVPNSKYRLARSNSRHSTSGSVNSAPTTPRRLTLPQPSFNSKLERIVSEGVEELRP